MTVLPIVGRELAVSFHTGAVPTGCASGSAVALALFCVPCAFSEVPISEFGQGIFIFLGSVNSAFASWRGFPHRRQSLRRKTGRNSRPPLPDRSEGIRRGAGQDGLEFSRRFFRAARRFSRAGPAADDRRAGRRGVLADDAGFHRHDVFFLGLGMLVSAASREGRQAMGGTFVILAFLVGVLPLLWLVQSQLSNRLPLDFLLWPNPVYAFIKGFDDSYLTIFGTAGFLDGDGDPLYPGDGQHPRRQFAAAALVAKRFRRRCDPGVAHAFDSWQSAAAASTVGREKPLPLVALGDRAGQSALNRLLILLGLLWFGTVVLSTERSLMGMYFSFTLMLTFGLHFAAKILIASESGRRFHQDRQSGAMELLLATPLPTEEIVNGQRDALRIQFHRALWLISIVNVLTLLAGIATFVVRVLQNACRNHEFSLGPDCHDERSFPRRRCPALAGCQRADLAGNVAGIDRKKISPLRPGGLGPGDGPALAGVPVFLCDWTDDGRRGQ